MPFLAELGTQDQKLRFLPAIADGELWMSVAVYDDPTEPLREGIRMHAERCEDDDGTEFRLDGTKVLVPYGGDVDAVVVAARTRDAGDYDGVSLFAIERGGSWRPSDPIRPLAWVRSSNTL